MAIDRTTLRRALAGRTAVLAFAVLAAFWIPAYAGWLFDPLIGLLYPLWLPGYLAVLLASGLRNVYLPWLGSGAAFWAVACGFLYVEAVLLAGIYRSLRHIYRTYQRGRSRPAA